MSTLAASFPDWSLPAVGVLFAVAALVIAFVGTRMARLADRLADLTGLGEALFGASLLGMCTSLPGIVSSVTAAAHGHAQLAVSNAVGGIAAQTMFLAIADLSYPHANLEHAAASLQNLLQAALLITLLSIPLLATGAPSSTFLGVHPMTAVIFLSYGAGTTMIARSRDRPSWLPRQTRETKLDRPAEDPVGKIGVVPVWIAFLASAIVVALAGYVVAQAGIAIADRTRLSETVVGMLLTAIATSLPELVTSIAAVRHGALTLAVGGIVGGNVFDVLFLAFSDIAYRDGSIYHAMGRADVFLISLGITLTAVLLLGLLRREKSGIGNIGFESFLMLVIYGTGAVVLVLQ